MPRFSFVPTMNANNNCTHPRRLGNGADASSLQVTVIIHITPSLFAITSALVSILKASYTHTQAHTSSSSSGPGS
jgi:hypothetical protein